MRTDIDQPIRLKDYSPPAWLVETVKLDFALHPTQTKVRATLALRPNPESGAAPLILGGFSQGAMLAFDIALRSERAIRGLVQLSGARIAERLWNPRLATRAGTPVFMSHGLRDPDLSFPAAKAFAGDLEAAGWGVDFCAFDGAHEVPLVALRGLKRFLLRV